ncbi:hypothetical protein M408DRAFT_330843 [Serendipita vermifera MAFF 305830]|uniref:CENP-V/GFA domain-containing protein n=1 Tax=Serendipita vermifera MAFF 305830 TaxID=933852 RepID=A0A0C2WI89_SERVB|nr:hypothetical protein M408DRAFT_330843 [Serendipita vermifera MAFF 305830]
MLVGGCHCGTVTYEFPPAPTIDLDGADVPDLLKNNIVPPSEQRFPERGTLNKWRASHCHCGACRRTVGALMVDWVNVPSADLVIHRKGPTGKYRASDHASREFCQTCGTSLFFLDDDEPEIIDVTVASIKTPNVFDFIEFNGHIWVEDAASLVLDEAGKGGGLTGVLVDGLPRSVQSRGTKPF